MNDPRFGKLARTLIHHSTRLQAGEHLLVEAFDIPAEMTLALVREAKFVGGYPHVCLRDSRVQRELVGAAANEQLDIWSANDLDRMKRMDAYIGMRGSHNVSEMAGVRDADLQNYAKRYATPVHGEQRVKRTRWCVLRWPTPSMAQLAGQPTGDFEDFYFKVCTLDYAKMADAAAKLVDRMNRTDRVHLVGPGDTDLRFSIKDIPAVACTGSHNIPDGECFTAPVRDSVEGIIHYNTPTIYQGKSFENVKLTFANGRIVEATADQGEEHLAGVFDTDEGARSIGEFAIGFNPHIREPMRDILFDEKIAGSLHFTPGRCYEDASNGNVSDIHWDLVLIQREDYGGGSVSFDDQVIRRDGMFIDEELRSLNPAALMTAGG
ncbi:MAG: aminopeptidase [Planctomycetota bacterium]